MIMVGGAALRLRCAVVSVGDRHGVWVCPWGLRRRRGGGSLLDRGDQRGQ